MVFVEASWELKGGLHGRSQAAHLAPISISWMDRYIDRLYIQIHNMLIISYYILLLWFLIFVILQYYTQTPRFPQTQNSVITREFCTASNNRKDFMFSYVEHVASSNHKARKCRFYISYRTNHTIIRVSYRVSRRYQNPAPHGTSNHSGIIRGSFRVSTRYQCSPAPWNN